MLKVETKKAKIYRQSLISLRFCQTKEEAIKITYQKNRGKKKGKEEGQTNDLKDRDSGFM